MPEPDRERFDTIAIYIALSILALVAATWIGNDPAALHLRADFAVAYWANIGAAMKSNDAPAQSRSRASSCAISIPHANRFAAATTNEGWMQARTHPSS